MIVGFFCNTMKQWTSHALSAPLRVQQQSVILLQRLLFHPLISISGIYFQRAISPGSHKDQTRRVIKIQAHTSAGNRSDPCLKSKISMVLGVGLVMPLLCIGWWGGTQTRSILPQPVPALREWLQFGGSVGFSSATQPRVISWNSLGQPKGSRDHSKWETFGPNRNPPRNHPTYSFKTNPVIGERGYYIYSGPQTFSRHRPV